MIPSIESLQQALHRHQRWLALVLLVFALVLIWMLSIHPYMQRYRNLDVQLESLQRQRVALEAVVEEIPLLQYALENQRPDATLLLPAAEYNIASAEFQSRIDSLLRESVESGCVFHSRQDVTRGRSEDSGAIALRLEMECAYEPLIRFIHALESARPLIFIDGLMIASRRRGRSYSDAPQDVVFMTQIEVSAFRAAEAGL